MTSSRPQNERIASSIPCSQSQKRFWFESQLHPENPGLNVAVRWRLEGEVVNARLEEAWRLIIARHQPLRTAFATVAGEPHQIVEATIPFHIPVVDLTALTESDANAEADRVASLEAQRTFDVATPPLIRVTHVRVRPNLSTLLVTAHHTVCDGWSIGVLAREMGQICAALSAGHSPDLPPLTTTYADYTAWEQQSLASSAWLAEEVAERLQGFEQFEIVPDKPRPPVQTANGDIVSLLLERSLTEALAELARTHNCTLFMTAYAALLTLLNRYSGETDIVLGTQVAGREEVEFEQLVGTFVNTVALRTDLSGDPRFSDLLLNARDTVTDALELRHVPLEDLVAIVNPKRDLSRNALFSINFVYQRSFIQNETYGAFKLVDLPSRSAGPICDLNFFMVERPEGWRVSCEFNTDLYQRETVTRILDRFLATLRAVVRDPSLPISQLATMDEAERRQVLALGSAETTAYGRDLSVHHIFAEQVRQTPDAIAVDDGMATLSYAQLDRRSNQFARYLKGVGVGAGSAVGVALERSLSVPVVLLGILKAGAAYVPLAPEYPLERIAFILDDAAVGFVLTEQKHRARLPSAPLTVIDVHVVAPTVAAQSDEALEEAAGPEAPAYVMYTSGSTGRPKGVAVVHRGIARLVRRTNYVALGADDVVFQYAPLAFDASTFELWGPLLNGGRLAIAPPGVLSLAELDRALEKLGVTTLWLTAAVFRESTELGLNSFRRLRRLLVGGDVVSPSHAKRFIADFPACRLINGYGPTENTTFSCAYVVPSADAIGENVPIGRPIANSSAYVLDARMQPVPFGVVGELCVGGDGLARGYLNLPELTAERFVPDPFANDATARLYRTGDLVRQRVDGVIEFLGRIDDQVKIRGFRIEPREVAAALANHPDVADAIAVVGTEPSGDKAIWAYVVPRDAALGTLNAEALSAWAAARLPTYMVPSAVVLLEALPLHPSGKVNRSALPAPQRPVAAESAMYRSVTEARLGAILSNLLGVERVERDVDIFALGFHSLLAVRFAAQVQQECGLELRLRTLFEHPTIAAIAAQVDASQDARPVPAAPIVTLNAAGTRAPLFFFHGDLFAEGLYAHRLSAALGPDQPVHAVAPHATAGLRMLPTIEDMAADYAARIRAVQPQGPYRLGGFCASGLVAYELARILQASGERVDKLVLVNSSPMPSRKLAPFDALVRRFGLDARLEPRVRERICYNLARLHSAAVTGPFAGLKALVRAFRSLLGRSHATPGVQEPQPFEKRRGGKETESSFAHLVAAFTYHPKAYPGAVSLIWSEDQRTMFDDPTMGWGQVANHIDVVSMSGGHVAALSERIEELSSVVDSVLKES